MINRYLFVLLSLLFYLSGGLLAKEGKAKKVSKEDAEVLEALGASVGTNFYKFGFDDTELEFFLKGLRQGLAGEVKEKDIRSMGPRIGIVCFLSFSFSFSLYIYNLFCQYDFLYN